MVQNECSSRLPLDEKIYTHEKKSMTVMMVMMWMVLQRNPVSP